jgi:hypothetical protein
MNREYTILEDGIIQYSEDGKLVSIPPVESNSDYQAYLKNLEENK